MPDSIPADLRSDEPDARAGTPPSTAARVAVSVAAVGPGGEDPRAAEHLAVDQLVERLLPALIAKLSATGLAEIEVREGPWKIRLRRPLEVTGSGRRATDRQFRLPVAGAPGPDRAAGHAAPGAPSHVAGPAVGHVPAAGARGLDAARTAAAREVPAVASPAVGVFRPRPGISGSRVRAGDRLGAVEMLGIPQEVLAHADGIVGRLVADAGEGVEYGQPLIELRPAGASVEPSGVEPADGQVSGDEPLAPAAAAAGERA